MAFVFVYIKQASINFVCLCEFLTSPTLFILRLSPAEPNNVHCFCGQPKMKSPEGIRIWGRFRVIQIETLIKHWLKLVCLFGRNFLTDSNILRHICELYKEQVSFVYQHHNSELLSSLWQDRWLKFGPNSLLKKSFPYLRKNIRF